MCEFAVTIIMIMIILTGRERKQYWAEGEIVSLERRRLKLKYKSTILT